MSGDGPSRRRRIAGEGKAAVPAKKAAVVRKAPAVLAKKAIPSNRPVKKVDLNKLPPPPAPKTPPKSVEPPRWARPPRGELRWLVPAALATVAVLVLGSLLVVRGISHRSGGTDSSNSQATTAARAAAETIFSFRYDKLPAHLSASKKTMTKSFAKDFDKIAPALTELAPQRKIVVQAVTREAAAIDCGSTCSSTKANILMFVDQARLVGGSGEPTVFGNRITVSMVKQGNTWLVSDIRAL